jgi:hypothetical protein
MDYRGIRKSLLSVTSLSVEFLAIVAVAAALTAVLF